MAQIFRTQFCEDIFTHKYKHKQCETWEELSKTLIREVCGKYLPEEQLKQLEEQHSEMKCIAGGRYLYYAGRGMKYYNNCFLFKSFEDSREDWAYLSWKAESCLMTGGGIGNDYSIYRSKGSLLSKTGGFASGPISKMKMINEIGREVMQGGSRRSAIYASLNWRHPDAGEFLHCKDWNAMPVSGAYDENGNNITIGYLKEKDFNYPAPLDMTNISLNYDNAFLEEIYDKPYEELYEIYKKGGYKAVSELPVVKIPLTFLENCRQALKTGEPGFSFNFFDKENETARNACQPGWATVLTPEGIKTFNEIGVGSIIWSTEGWTKVVKKWSNGIKPVYKISFQDGNEFIGTLDHELIIESDDDECKKCKAEDILKNNFKVYCFNYNPDSILNKFTEDPNLISNRFTTPLRHLSDKHISTEEVYKITVDNNTHTYWTGGVNVANCTEVTSEDDSDVCNLGSINMAEIETIEEFESVVRNMTAFLLCGTLEAQLPYEKVYEVRNKNRRLGLGLMGVHEWLLKRGYRYEVTKELHEWLKVFRDASKDEGTKLAQRLGISIPVAFCAIAPTGSIGILAGTSTGIEPLFAVAYKRRYLKGMKEWHYQYVVDGTAKILVDNFNINPHDIETSLDLASDYERRIQFQADVQDYIDMSISSTINMPRWGTELNNDTRVEEFARVLAKYAVRLRGFTCYPDGARGGQPLVPVDYYEALSSVGQEFKEQFHDVCDITNKGGTCGS